MTMQTYAEKMADKARSIDGFKEFSLLGAREKVATILHMIGRVKGVFSTYSLHDITHVQAMLSMLEWLIPPETKSRLTPPEWLLIVLSSYLHDLGMIVTSDEFEAKETDPDFVAFRNSLENDPDSRDYLDRLERIPEDDRDTFLYQEFIRAHHPQRIREWITGEHKTNWGEELQPIAQEINNMLNSLPVRFRRNLADICESHHKDNMEDRSYFPLCQRYGQNTLANTQYVALLLRTTDLLHITQDRTPSLMFRTLKISDPMGVEEWKKQMGTFSVQMKCREFRPDDTESHVIIVSADFEEERPFFVLTEYIAYANQQIEQTFRWAKKSQSELDAQHYSFPWHRVQGDIRVQGNEPMPMRFELDRGRLLDLLVGHTIYNDPTVAIRELLQNGVDAVRYQHYLDKKTIPLKDTQPEMGQVYVKWNPTKRELVIRDTGIGMDLDIIKYHLMTVGSSFYDTPSFKADSSDFIPISRFGIGILTCFMVSDNIEILTCKEKKGYRIKMSSVQADYLLKTMDEGENALAEIGEHGTKVSLIMRPSVDFNKRSVLDIVRHWVVMPECKVVYEEEGSASIKVGFESPKDALRYFLFESGDEKDTTCSSDDTEIESKQVKVDGESYDLAFAVRRAYTPERNFVIEMPKGAPSTCLEGIRVDETLPGFKNFAAILSVRNNRAFRTTVSRDRLERDEEYVRVALICTEMLTSYVADEAQRIQKAEGHPLSQASTAIRWLFSFILDATDNKEVATKVKELQGSMSQIVVESHKASTGTHRPSRELISLDELSSIGTFWTIEARVVDYLGVISRDLGRELSFTEFISGIAPELCNPLVSPIISDAHHYKENILSSHEPEVVFFSKSHQQTTVKWVKRKSPVMIMKEFDKKELSFVQPIMNMNVLNNYHVNLLQSFYDNATCLKEILYSKLEGDLPEVKGVRMRLGVILEPKSDYANIWRGLINAIITLQEEPPSPEKGLLIFMAFLVHDEYTLHRRRYSIFNEILNITGADLLWKTTITESQERGILQRFGLTLPQDIRDIRGENSKWFDATSYWLDWNK